jgi:hypothetical protein
MREEDQKVGKKGLPQAVESEARLSIEHLAHPITFPLINIIFSVDWSYPCSILRRQRLDLS